MKLILILEDEPFIAMDLKYACEDEGLAAVTTGNIEQAMAAMAQHRFFGAILDVNLGHGETCQEVAEELRDRHIPFVLNTGDLNRSGEFVRRMHAPIISKPNASSEVVRTLLCHGASAVAARQR